MENYIFLDTFALTQLTNDYCDELADYLLLKDYSIVLTSMELVELYNPNPEGDDRINKISNLLTSIPFVICDQVKIMKAEEAAYPQTIDKLPLEYSSKEIFIRLPSTEKKEIIYKLFSIGLPEYGIDLKAWTKKHHFNKTTWPQSVKNIIDNATSSGVINSKDKFLQSLDLRLCENILKSIESINIKNWEQLNQSDKKNLLKIDQIIDKHDSWRMKGIHFSSLVFWYEYVKAKKKIQPSDEADIYYSLMFPYCNAVIIDKSRYDCATKIQNNETGYNKLKFYDINTFREELTNHS